MKKILINYADKCFYESQKHNAETGVRYGFDTTIQYRRKDIDYVFASKHADILSSSKGAGYWLWKPYLIVKTLDQMAEGDILMYSDSGSDFIASVQPLIDWCLRDERGVMVFRMAHRMGVWTKRDTYVYMNCDSQPYYESMQCLGGFNLWRKNKRSIDFAKEWLNYCCDRRILTDDPNVCGLPNLPGFRDHRHDQAILSVMVVRDGVPAQRDMSQFGHSGYDLTTPTLQEYAAMFTASFGEIVLCHRNKQ